MIRQNDDFEQMIRENLRQEAEDIEKEVNESGVEDISAEQKEAIRLKLKNRIAANERERAYAGLSEEDREALEIGRKIREEQKAGKKKKRVIKGIKYAAAAAVAAVVCTGVYSMTSVGHGEKFASTIEQMVGGRKIVQIESDEENRILETEEEKAFQAIKEMFGVEIVKIVRRKEMTFENMNLDENMQVAQMKYQYKGENLWYTISAGYYDSSFGFDAEDEILEKEKVKVNDTVAEISVYRRKESGKIKCSGHFSYQKLEYFLAGNISKEDFVKILKNLYFL